MICPNCKADVDQGAKFCGECGSPIPQTKTCPSCHTSLPPTAKFCGECGCNLLTGTPANSSPIGNKNVIAGDVNFNVTSVNNVSTNNQVTNTQNTTNTTVDNSNIHQNDAPQDDSGTEALKSALLGFYSSSSEAALPTLLQQIDAVRQSLNLPHTKVLEALKDWDEEEEISTPIAEGIEEWFRRVCEKASGADALYYLGLCYEYGTCGPDFDADLGKAVDCFLRAAEQGCAVAKPYLQALNPTKLIVKFRPETVMAIGITHFDHPSKIYALSLAEREYYQKAQNHQEVKIYPMCKGIAIHVTAESILNGTVQEYTYPTDDWEDKEYWGYWDDCEHESNMDEESADLIVTNYFDGCELTFTAVVEGEFSPDKLEFFNQVFYDGYEKKCSEQRAKELKKRLGSAAQIVKDIFYGCSPISLSLPVSAIKTPPFAGSSIVICNTDENWRRDFTFDIFNPVEHIRKVAVTFEGPGITLFDDPSSKSNSKHANDVLSRTMAYGYTEYPDLNHTHLKVTDLFSGEILCEGRIADHATLCERDWRKETGMTPPSSSDGRNVFVAAEHPKMRFRKTVTCHYNGAFDPKSVVIPYDTITIPNQQQPLQPVFQEKIKVCGSDTDNDDDLSTCRLTEEFQNVSLWYEDKAEIGTWEKPDQNAIDAFMTSHFKDNPID